MTASLDKLHSFNEPPPPAWTPQTVGWYCLFAIVTVAMLWMVVRAIRLWRANRYRREALRELATLDVKDLSALLKRTALSAWPRETVASLSGTSWLNFLDNAIKERSFQDSPGNRIEELAFNPVNLSTRDESTLRKLAGDWIRRHRVRA